MPRPLLFAPLLLLAAPLAAQEAREPQRLHPTQALLGFGPSVASDGDVSCAVWTETSPSYYVWASVSDGRGLSWSAPVRLDSDTTNEGKITQGDSVQVSGQNIYVAWRDDRTNGTDDEIFFTRSTDGGQTWEPDRRIDNGYAPGTEAVTAFGFAVDSPYVYVAMKVDSANGSDGIWVAASDDDGATFGSAVYVSSLAAGNADAINVDVAAQGATCHVAWCDDRQGLNEEEVWYQRSDDGGVTWLAADVQLDSSPGGAGDAQTTGLDIAVSGANVAVAWSEERLSGSNEEIRFNASQDGGNSWLANDVRVGNYDPVSYDADFNSMAMHGDVILFTWRDNRTGIDQVYATVTGDFGATLTEHLICPDDGSTSPIAFAWEELLAISYAGGSTPQDHRVALSDDEGATFGPEISLSGTLFGDTDQTTLALNESYRNLIGVWQQDDPGTNHLYAGGLRPQQLAQPSLAVGSPVSFQGSGFPPSATGHYMLIAASASAGSVALPDGRISGLAQDNILSFTRSNLLIAPIGADGSAQTSPVVVPAAVGGVSLHLVAVAWAPGSGLGALTDVVVSTVQ